MLPWAADHVNGLGKLADRQRVRFAVAPVVAVGQMRIPLPGGVEEVEVASAPTSVRVTLRS